MVWHLLFLFLSDTGSSGMENHARQETSEDWLGAVCGAAQSRVSRRSEGISKLVLGLSTRNPGRAELQVLPLLFFRCNASVAVPRTPWRTAPSVEDWSQTQAMTEGLPLPSVWE